MKAENSLDLDKIEQYIYDRKYRIANSILLGNLQRLLKDMKESPLFRVFEYLKIICDKKQDLAAEIIATLRDFVDHNDEFIRLEAMEILVKISARYPGLLAHLVEKIFARFYDSERDIKLLALEISYNYLTGAKSGGYEVDRKEITGFFLKMLEDEAWTVRALSLEYLQKLIPDSHLTLIKEIMENVFVLRHDDDDEVRLGVAITMKLMGQTLPLSEMGKYRSLLQLYLRDEDWLVVEKGLWILGELGQSHSEKVHPFWSQLINYYADPNTLIQSRTIEVFYKFGQSNSKRVITFLLEEIRENVKNEEILQGIEDTFTTLGVNNSPWVLPLLLKKLSVEDEVVQDLVAESLRNIYREQTTSVLQEIKRLFSLLYSPDWKTREQTVIALGNVARILYLKTIAAWTMVNFQELNAQEKDPEVLAAISNTTELLETRFGVSLKEEIQAILDQQEYFHQEIEGLHRLPQMLRDEIETLITRKELNKAEETLETRTIEIISKLQDFENLLEESEFKRFSPETYEKWVSVRESIEENLTDIKSIEYDKILEARFLYHEDLDAIVEDLQTRIDVIKADYESLSNTSKNLNIWFDDQEQYFDQIEQYLRDLTRLQQHVNKLEFEIGQVWLENMDFKEFLEGVTVNWVNAKLNIQQFLADMFARFVDARKKLKELDLKDDRILQEISFRLLLRSFQRTIASSIEGLKAIFNDLDGLATPVKTKLKLKRYAEARNLLENIMENFRENLKERNQEISQIYEELDELQNNVQVSNQIRSGLLHWNQMQNEIESKLQTFYQELTEEIIVQELREYHQILNPISLNHLAKIQQRDVESLEEILLEILRKRKIPIKIQNQKIYALEQKKQDVMLLFSKKIEVVGGLLELALRVHNPMRVFVHDLKLFFHFPKDLNFLEEKSDFQLIERKEFEPGATHVYSWKFKLPPISQHHAYSVKKFQLDISFKDITGKTIKLKKDIDLVV